MWTPFPLCAELLLEKTGERLHCPTAAALQPCRLWQFPPWRDDSTGLRYTTRPLVAASVAAASGFAWHGVRSALATLVTSNTILPAAADDGALTTQSKNLQKQIVLRSAHQRRSLSGAIPRRQCNAPVVAGGSRHHPRLATATRQPAGRADGALCSTVGMSPALSRLRRLGGGFSRPLDCLTIRGDRHRAGGRAVRVTRCRGRRQGVREGKVVVGRRLGARAPVSIVPAPLPPRKGVG